MGRDREKPSGNKVPFQTFLPDLLKLTISLGHDEAILLSLGALFAQFSWGHQEICSHFFKEQGLQTKNYVMYKNTWLWEANLSV